MKNVLLLVLIFGVSLLSAQDKSAKDYKIEGAEAYKTKNYQKGLTSFEKSIQMYEANGKVDTSLYYNAAICALKVGNYDKSLNYFNRSISLDYKPCKSQLYKANAYKKKKDYMAMETECNNGISSCPKYKKKFNDLLFGYYLKSGLNIFNTAAKMQADVTPLASTDPDKYVAEMEKVKAAFNRSIPMLEKANKINPEDQNCSKALNQARKIVATDI
jgi:tetratricopeptide (TPR) repeat protein